MNELKVIVVCISSIRFLAAILFSCCAGGVSALTFTEAFELARKNDSSFLSTQANYQAAKERSNIAFSALLPQLNISSNTAQNHREYVTKSTPETTDIQKFSSNSAQINLTQALWRHTERIALTQANLAAQQGESQVVAAEHDLFVRFLQAWLDVISARDNIYFSAKKSDAARKLRDQKIRAAELGLASDPELEDALARYEKALALQASADADEEAKLSSLEQIIGPVEKFTPPSLSEDQPMIGLPENPLSNCLELAENSNAAIIAAAYGVRAANEEIRKQRAGHEPTLDITGSYGRTAQGAGTTPTLQGYTNTQGTIGLQLNIPIYSGGSQSAKVREVIALQKKSTQELENARRAVRSACKQAWFGIQAGIARHNAATQSVKSDTASLRAATSGKKHELKTDFDVLQATQQLYEDLHDLQNARYEILLNKFKLKAVSGQLTTDDVIALNAAFVQATPNPEAPLDNSSTSQLISPAALVHSHE